MLLYSSPDSDLIHTDEGWDIAAGAESQPEVYCSWDLDVEEETDLAMRWYAGDDDCERELIADPDEERRRVWYGSCWDETPPAAGHEKKTARDPILEQPAATPRRQCAPLVKLLTNYLRFHGQPSGRFRDGEDAPHPQSNDSTRVRSGLPHGRPVHAGSYFTKPE